MYLAKLCAYAASSCSYVDWFCEYATESRRYWNQL